MQKELQRNVFSLLLRNVVDTGLLIEDTNKQFQSKLHVET